MLDVSLGRENAVRVMLSEMGVQMKKKEAPSQAKTKVKRKRRKGDQDSDSSDSDDGMQLDEFLPPESDTRWIGCDACHQWRRLPWNVDAEDLGEHWTCSLRSWDPENASCDAMADPWDPSREDITATAITGEGNEVIAVGAWRDVFCIRDKVSR